MLRFAPSTENGLPLIWARPRFCEDTFSRLNREETKKVAGEHADNAKPYEIVKASELCEVRFSRVSSEETENLAGKGYRQLET